MPHPVQAGKEVLPLGLVSVRIIPSYAGRHLSLGFSFTWRTVEALVGFPYSLYGSVCYAEHLADLVSNKLPSTHGSRVDVGFVSYVAHSLHYFVDDYAQRIAKTIIDEASE